VQGQSGITLLVDGRAESHIRQGITTEIIGEGGTPALWTPTILRRDPSIAESIAPLKVTVDWETMPGYFGRLTRGGISINVGAFASADMIRAEVIGFDDRAPTAAELAAMESNLDDAMKNGAFGLATALIYPPMSFMKTDEIVALAKVVSRRGGIYISHVRGEGGEAMNAIREAIAIGERANVPVVIYHLKVAGRAAWGTMGKIAALVDEARARGVRISACEYPYTAAGTALTALLPGWAFEGGIERLVLRLKDASERTRMRRAMESADAGLGPIDFSTIEIAWVRGSADQSVMGKRIAVIAAARHEDPWDTYFSILAESRADVFAFYHVMSEADVRAAMTLPWVSFGTDSEATTRAGELGRGLVHPRAYGTFPRILGHYVRDEHVLTLEDAVRKMTSLAAAQLGVRERGTLREGWFADLAVFDPRTVKDHATFQNPRRLPTGIPYVVVNGVVTVDHDALTGARAGRALLGPATSAH
jgi:N-acyl-D-amino-acid deacylase